MKAFVRVAVGLSTLVMATSPALADKFHVDMATEHQVFKDYLLKGQKVCLEFKNANIGGFAQAHLRRTSNGENKDLANAFGGRCLTMNAAMGGVYVIYVSPVDVPLTVEVVSQPTGIPNIPLYSKSYSQEMKRARISN